MPGMTGSGLKSAIETAFAPETVLDGGERLLKFCNAVVQYIQANAVVLPDSLIVTDPDDGVLPVTGTGKVQ